MGVIKHLTTGLALTIGVIGLGAPARATAVIGGSTSVTLTAAPVFTDAKIAVAPTGTATATVNGGIPTVTFPITGGTLNDSTGALLLNHNGSGLLFSKGNNSLAIGNFVVDTAALLISGSATVNGTTNLSNVPLFNIVVGAPSSPPNLTLTQQAASALNSVFDLNLSAGTTVGSASINAAVPEPATWTMMLLGFAAIGVSVRRRAHRVAIA